MDYLRYYFGTILVCIAIWGFAHGGHWVWVGVGLLIPITILDVLAKPDLNMRKINHPFIVNIPLYLHLFFMIGYMQALYIGSTRRSRLQALSLL